MVFQSLLPPVPDLPFPNAHNFFLGRPDQAEWEDYVLHVDAVTGKTRKWSEFKDRVARGATALGDPARFPHEENAIVAILSENCVVSFLDWLSSSSRVLMENSPGCGVRRSTLRLFIHYWLLAFHLPYSQRHRPHTN